MVTTVHTQPGEQVALHRLWWVAPVTILPAIAAHVMIRLFAVAILQPDPAFRTLTPGPPILFTTRPLMLMHVVAWAMSAGLLIRLARV